MFFLSNFYSLRYTCFFLETQNSKLKTQTSNLKPQTSNLKPQTSNLKPQTSNHILRFILCNANLLRFGESSGWYRIMLLPQNCAAICVALRRLSTPQAEFPALANILLPVSAAQIYNESGATVRPPFYAFLSPL